MTWLEFLWLTVFFLSVVFSCLLALEHYNQLVDEKTAECAVVSNASGILYVSDEPTWVFRAYCFFGGEVVDVSEA